MNSDDGSHGAISDQADQLRQTGEWNMDGETDGAAEGEKSNRLSSSDFLGLSVPSNAGQPSAKKRRMNQFNPNPDEAFVANVLSSSLSQPSDKVESLVASYQGNQSGNFFLDSSTSSYFPAYMKYPSFQQGTFSYVVGEHLTTSQILSLDARALALSASPNFNPDEVFPEYAGSTTSDAITQLSMTNSFLASNSSSLFQTPNPSTTPSSPRPSSDSSQSTPMPTFPLPSLLPAVSKPIPAAVSASQSSSSSSLTLPSRKAPSSTISASLEQTIRQKTTNTFFFTEPHKWVCDPNAIRCVSDLVKHYKEVIVTMMKDLRAEQGSLRLFPRSVTLKNDLDKLYHQHNRARAMIGDCLQKTSRILHEEILLPHTTQEAFWLERDLRLELEQLLLYEEELAELRKAPNNSHTVAKLVIVKQPFPKPIKKSTTVTGADSEHEEPTVVRLMTGAKVCFKPEESVIAEVISEDPRRGEEKFKAGERQLDEEGFATFSDLQFEKPTRLNMANLFFSVRVRFIGDESHPPVVRSVRSDPSAPFVVITNESQWGDSEGILMTQKIFGSHSSKVNWTNLANHIQLHFIRSTRQDLIKPERPLSQNDLNYLARTLFDDKKEITKEEFTKFWEWFGLACRRIRHQLPFHTLWMKGMVFGFISRNESETLLQNEDVGTFIIRFSVTSPGKLVLSYVKYDHRQKRKETCHFLLAGGPREAPKHLQHMLEKKHELTHVLRLHTDFNPTGPLVYREPKEVCYAKEGRRSSVSAPLSSGYEVDDSVLP